MEDIFDKAVILNIVKRDFIDIYELVKKVWEEHSNERYYIHMSVEFYSRGRQSNIDCYKQLRNILEDYKLI